MPSAHVRKKIRFNVIISIRMLSSAWPSIILIIDIIHCFRCLAVGSTDSLFPQSPSNCLNVFEIQILTFQIRILTTLFIEHSPVERPAG